MTNKLKRATILTPILLALLFVTATSAFAMPPETGRYYKITVRHSGKCLEVYGGATNLWNGASIIQGDCNDTQNQQWMFILVRPGVYKIRARHSGKVMDVFGGLYSTGNGVHVQQRDDNGLLNQLWAVRQRPDGYYYFIAQHSQKSLNISGASTFNGAQAIQWDWSADATNEQFLLTPVCSQP